VGDLHTPREIQTHQQLGVPGDEVGVTPLSTANLKDHASCIGFWRKVGLEAIPSGSPIIDGQLSVGQLQMLEAVSGEGFEDCRLWICDRLNLSGEALGVDRAQEGDQQIWRKEAGYPLDDGIALA